MQKNFQNRIKFGVRLSGRESDDALTLAPTPGLPSLHTATYSSSKGTSEALCQLFSCWTITGTDFKFSNLVGGSVGVQGGSNKRLGTAANFEPLLSLSSA